MENKDIDYSVIIDPSASDRMYKHFAFLARVSEDAANRPLDQLTEDIESLRHMPYRNPAYDRPYLPIGRYRCMVSSNRYLIVYQIIQNKVFVDDIQDSRQYDDKNLLGDC